VRVSVLDMQHGCDIGEKPAEPAEPAPAPAGGVHYVEAKLELRSHLRARERQFGWREVKGEPGRPPADQTRIQQLKLELHDYLEAAHLSGRRPKMDPECLDYVWERIEARGWPIAKTTAYRKVVQPVHRFLWPAD
jgi:hypothetical protein